MAVGQPVMKRGRADRFLGPGIAVGGGLAGPDAGQHACMTSAEFDEFDNNSPLTPTEQLDSDEVRNSDGDEVVDPPERWLDPEEKESLDDRLAEETPDVSPDDIDPRDADDRDQEETVLASDDEIDRRDPEQRGRERGQIDGTPEDGDSFFDVVE